MEGEAARGVELEAVVGRSASRQNGECEPIASTQGPRELRERALPRGPFSRLQLCSARQSAPQARGSF